MQSSEIRDRFLRFFERNGHAVLPSASLVPADDPTLLFTNAGMVPFKKVFLGQEQPVAGRRAASSQKCVRAGGKHNDLEQVGHTARHHTFFEMLGNFSFGDYFKRDAIRLAWDFLTGELGLDPAHLRVTVYQEDKDARSLWADVAGLSQARIYRLGEKDNFWQMADTGPCGPCSEIYVDLAHVTDDWSVPKGARGEWTEKDRPEFSQQAFVEGAEAGRFLEVWNLVFMQFDRQSDGSLTPLPKPSVDTGMGLERVAAVMQRRANNFHTDLFTPLLESVGAATGIPYSRVSEKRLPRTRGATYASHRVIADHARAVAFLLADGVFPSNEGRGYVLRRILRRAVRHAWLLGKDEPVLYTVVAAVIANMGDVYPELRSRQKHVLDTTRAEEERFLATIEGGMRRFNEIAPAATTQGSTAVRGTIAGEDAFRLYDTFGFPIDLTELMARERGYTVDVAGFEQALEGQRAQSREERKTRQAAVEVGAQLVETAGEAAAGSTEFVGYETLEVSTRLTAATLDSQGQVTLVLERSPFYLESGGQISDVGEVIGHGWRVDVTDVRRIEGSTRLVGKLTGSWDGVARSLDSRQPVLARVPRDRRLDTERNHTATHLLHAVLREILGEHVHQAGSLVAPDRLRFDFTHHGPLTPEQLDAVEESVNRGIFAAEPVVFEQRPYGEAIAMGAMALFGEKYGDLVRVVSIPGRSIELCGGTHVRNTSEIGLFRIVAEKSVAAGVRRIEALTGRRAYEWLRDRARQLTEIEEIVHPKSEGVVAAVEHVVAEARKARTTQRAVISGLDETVYSLAENAPFVEGVRVIATQVPVPDLDSLRVMGDKLRVAMGTGIAVLSAGLDSGKHTLLVVVTDDLRERGVRADVLIREIAAAAGGRGGGKPHMAQAGISKPERIPDVLASVPELVAPHLQALR